MPRRKTLEKYALFGLHLREDQKWNESKEMPPGQSKSTDGAFIVVAAAPLPSLLHMGECVVCVHVCVKNKGRGGGSLSHAHAMYSPTATALCTAARQRRKEKLSSALHIAITLGAPISPPCQRTAKGSGEGEDGVFCSQKKNEDKNKRKEGKGASPVFLIGR